MFTQTILAAALLIASSAPLQNADSRNAGQMREVDTPPAKSTDGSNASAPKPATPITANQSATGDKPAVNAASTDGSSIRPAPPRTGSIDGPEPRRRTSPSDVLKRLQKRQDTDRAIIPPQTPGTTRVKRTAISEAAIPDNSIRPVDRKLMPDGSRIVDRAGRLTRDGDFLTYTFESRGEGPVEVPLRLIPNRLLEDMEIIAEGGRKSVVFVVSGEVTEYRGVNYLMIQKLLIRPELGNFR